MAQETEAACLIAAGTAYRERILIHPATGGDLFAGVRPGGFSIYDGDEPIFHLDFEGRWQRSFIGGIHYLKGLDGEVRAVDRVRLASGLTLRRRTLPPRERDALDFRIRERILGWIELTRSGRFAASDREHRATPLGPPRLLELLGRAARWDGDAWGADRDRFRATYSPLPFLPPGCVNPVVLQAGPGPRFGTGRSGGPPARAVEAFEGHARAVAALHGRRLAACRDIFLDGLDPLARPGDEALSILRATARLFPPGRAAAGPASIDEAARPSGSIQILIDDFPAARPAVAFWDAARGLGLRRVTLGIESGDPAVRLRHGKSWPDDRLGPVVADLAAAGIEVDLALLIGAGGPGGPTAHRGATIGLVGSIPPGPARRIFLLDARHLDGRFDGGPAASDAEVAAEAAELKARLGSGSASGDRVAVIAYNLDKQPT